MLKEMYRNGIIAGNDLTRMEEDSITAIRTVEQNTATSRPVGQLYTVKDAYEYLLNADTTHYKKKVLQQCNLNNYITPNLIYDEAKSEAAQKDLLSNISYANGFTDCVRSDALQNRFQAGSGSAPSPACVRSIFS